MKIGDRVVVAIQEASRWAKGAVEVLNGQVGTVTEIRPVSSIGTGGILVRFDKPIGAWWSYQTPVRGVWLDPAEVKPAPVLPSLGRRVCVSVDGAEVSILSLDAFLLANAEDAFTCAAVGALKPGESIALGGGAAPALLVVAL